MVCIRSADNRHFVRIDVWYRTISCGYLRRYRRLNIEANDEGQGNDKINKD